MSARIQPRPVRMSRWFFEVQHCAAKHVVLSLVQPDVIEDETDDPPFPGDADRVSESSKCQGGFDCLLVFIAKALFLAICTFLLIWTIVMLGMTARIVTGYTFELSWLNWPLWLVLVFWLPTPFIFYFCKTIISIYFNENRK